MKFIEKRIKFTMLRQNIETRFLLIMWENRRKSRKNSEESKNLFYELQWTKLTKVHEMIKKVFLYQYWKNSTKREKKKIKIA